MSLVLAAGLAQPALAGQKDEKKDDKKAQSGKSAKNAKAKTAGKKAPNAATSKKATKRKAPARPADAANKAPAGDTAPDAPAPLLQRPADKPAPAAERNASAPLHRRARSVSGGLASARPQVRGPSAAAEVKKDESQVERSQVRATRREVAKSPVETLLDELHADVLNTRPKARGKISVTFRVGRGGVPANVLIFGFDDALDVALEKRVQDARLPASYAGRQISTTLVFRGK